MKMPASIMVLGQQVAIRARPEAELPKVYGQWKAKQRRIDIRTRMTRFDTVDTLLHEIFHSILTHQAREYSDKMEEHFVNSLAHGLTAVLKDNPDLRAWLDDVCRKMETP